MSGLPNKPHLHTCQGLQGAFQVGVWDVAGLPYLSEAHAVCVIEKHEDAHLICVHIQLMPLVAKGRPQI